MKNRAVAIFLLAVGISGMVFSAAFDVIRGGALNFGINQFAGFVVSAIVAIAGLHKIGVLESRIWNRLLTVVYAAGILVMGLRPAGSRLKSAGGMFQGVDLSASDVVINIAGFAPLGYFVVSWLLSAGRIRKKAAAVLLSAAVCTAVSLLIEAAQFYIPGRSSSASDVFFNGFGALGGAIFGLFEKDAPRKDPAKGA